MSAQPSVNIVLKRPDRTYTPGAPVNGFVIIDSPGQQMSHNGINLLFEGVLTLTHGIDAAAFSQSEQSQTAKIQIELAKAGKLPKGQTEIPFEFPLQTEKGVTLFETYHGIMINIRYSLAVEIQRGVFSKSLRKTVEIIIVNYSQEIRSLQPLEFEMSSDKRKKIADKSGKEPPTYKFRGRIDSRICNVVEPFTGEIEVIHSSLPIRSIELQLVRVETVVSSGKKGETEIQNIQIADGDLLHGTKMPMHMILPRLFTCSTMKSELFELQFEVNVVVLFQDQSLVSENIPIVFYRSKPRKNTVWTDL
ncbi:Down syndrome critical region protein 3 (DSCR3) [Blattamonas nauphoetae]|uniref:Down syndrome critical region protein 3 (DSCR3) n=1 Tax=Blattamonas nauphoetae TaxID=2049346 RepID=A0ABQ9YA11_9EUKA|nr:Down syndrome critical region protein 3 (DSCR3) [Blattamonas nauphoetae]